MKTIILAGMFLAIYFIIYTRQIKRKKESEINDVKQFQNNYSHLRQTHPKTTDSSEYHTKRKPDNNYNKYVTKYNSPEDYREKQS